MWTHKSKHLTLPLFSPHPTGVPVNLCHVPHNQYRNNWSTLSGLLDLPTTVALENHAPRSNFGPKNALILLTPDAFSIPQPQSSMTRSSFPQYSPCPQRSSKDFSRDDECNWGSLNLDFQYGGLCSRRIGRSGWIKYIHLDGGSYFYHPTSRIITEDDMENPEHLRSVEEIHEEFLGVLNADGILERLPKDITWIVVLDHFDVDQSTVSAVSYEAHSIINCAEGGPGGFLSCTSKTPNLNERTDIEYEIKTSNYWDCLETYPMHLKQTPKTICGDFLTSLSYNVTGRCIQVF